MESNRRKPAGKAAVSLALAASVLVGAVVAVTSRLQLPDAGPGVLAVTVPVPALVLLLVAWASAGLTASFRTGLLTGLLALAASFAALVVVLAVEGPVWMDRHGVFMLDGDPPRGPVSTTAVVLDIFSTGMWIGHLLVWASAVLIGAALGAWTGGRRSARARPNSLLPGA